MKTTTTKPAAKPPAAVSKPLTKAETDALVAASRNALRFLRSVRQLGGFTGQTIDGLIDGLAAALKASGR